MHSSRKGPSSDPDICIAFAVGCPLLLPDFPPLLCTLFQSQSTNTAAAAFFTMLYQLLPLLALLVPTQAARPENTSVCDYYTTELLKENSAANQYTLLTLLVNTAVIGNYAKPNVGIEVNGILNPGTYNGTAVNLLPFFNGGLASTNNGAKEGAVVNFLDDGGAAPLMANKPANGTDSNQLFMALDPYQVGYFITQVGLSAASFGVSNDDVTAVGTSLIKLFDHRCAPPTTIIPAQGDALQAVCVADTCPLSENAACGSYEAVVQPAVANGSMAAGGGSNGTGTVMSTKSVEGITMATGSATAAVNGTSTGIGAKNTTEPSSGAAVRVASSLASIGLTALILLV
ncbi:MAG: hypothetical protein Q9187_002104 [Circinaria calcarea]